MHRHEKVEEMVGQVPDKHDVPFRALFDASPTPLLVIAPPNWEIIAANEARLRVTGTALEDQIGKPLFDVFPDDPNDPEADGVRNLTASLERVVRTKSADVMKVQRYALRDANGQFVERWWTPVNTPVFDDEGAVEFIIHRVEDVTELMHMRGQAEARDQTAQDQQAIIERLRATEIALRESTERLFFFRELEERLFGAAAASDVMTVATEMLGRKLGASRCAYADVHGDSDRFWIRNDYNAPGMVTSAGAYSLDLFGPRAATDLRAGRALVVCDVAGELAPGAGREMFQSIGIDAIICCPLIKEGKLTAMMAVHQDRPRIWASEEITLVKEVAERCWAHVERVGAEARLRESEERLRLVVDNADVGFWDLDVVNNTLIWPPRTKAMFGISTDTPVTMQDFYDGLHFADREATAAAFAAATDPDKRALYDVEYRTIGKEDAVVRWVAAKGRGVFDPSGRCLRVAGTAIEITARRQAEEELRELNATLEARIAAALAEREEIQDALRQSQKMEAMGQLTGGVAHDFNNLLTPIVGSLDMLQRKGLGGEREQRMIAGAVQSAERARVLVQRLLAFARRQPLQLVPVDIAKLVTDMGALVSSTTGPQIRVSVETPKNLPLAKVDPNQLEMAILNLAVNARDAMPDGGTLRIQLVRRRLTPVIVPACGPGITSAFRWLIRVGAWTRPFSPVPWSRSSRPKVLGRERGLVCPWSMG
nr:PAS domain S-box protein [Neorhizobium vignae]